MNATSAAGPSTAPRYDVCDAGPGDRAYVLDSWRRSLERRPRSGVSRAAQDRQRERLVDTQRVILAVDRGGSIVAWCCFTALRSAPILHYVYVRAEVRGNGIASELARAAGVRIPSVVATSSSRAARAIVAAKGLHVAQIDVAEVLP